MDFKELTKSKDSTIQPESHIQRRRSSADLSTFGITNQQQDRSTQLKTIAVQKLEHDNLSDQQDLIQNSPRSTLQRQEVENIQNSQSEQSVQLQADPKPNLTGMPDKLKSGMEKLSGHDLSDVRVHYNSPKPAQLNAHAYAQGTNIHIASGQEKHLPHEAWHTVQQKQNRVKPTIKSNNVAINDSPSLEKEADVMGAKAMNL